MNLLIGQFLWYFPLAQFHTRVFTFLRAYNGEATRAFVFQARRRVRQLFWTIDLMHMMSQWQKVRPSLG